jgi:lysozyme family protein/peptidoglycan hydrolase-like protein with peptidoglycan-binding domain
MAFTFASLEDGYNRNWASLEIRPSASAAATKAASQLFKSKDTYQQIEAKTGVPWYFIGLVHYREASFNFSRYLGNGQPLGQVTTEVPRGRGPFASFTDGAVDALRLQGFVGASDWSIARILYRLEGYNGFGYHNFGVNSPYLYGGSTLYGPPEAKGGKYVSDGVFSASAVDTQLGTAVILKALMGLDQTISFGAAPSNPVSEPDDEQAADVLVVQRALNTLGASPPLVEDGIIGPKTMAAVAQFQQQNGLTPATGLLSAATIAAITKQATPGQQQQDPGQQQPGQIDLTPVLQRIENVLTQIQSGNLNLRANDPLTLVQKILAMAPLNTGQKPAPGPAAPAPNDQLQQIIKVLTVVLGQTPALGQVNGALGDTIGNLLNGKKAAIGIGGSLLTSLLAPISNLASDPTAGAFVKALAPVASLLPPNIALPVFLAIGAWGVLGKLEKWAQGTAPPPKVQT